MREHGPDADIMLVAERLGVTRQTIYRYYVDRGDVFGNVALQAVGEFVDGLMAHLATWDAGIDRLAQALVFAVRRLPADPRMSVLLKPEIAMGLLLSDEARGGLRASLELSGLGPELAPDEFGRFARLVHAMFVTELLAESNGSDEELLAFFRFVLAPFFVSEPTESHSE